MNFRITTFFFALLLTMLWVFGLMVAHKRSAGDQGLIVPKLQDAKITKVTVKRTGEKDAVDAEFEMGPDEKWYLQDGKQKVRVDAFRIDNIIKTIKEARPDESADVSKELANYGLKDPKLVVTLHGKDKDSSEKEWQFFVGNESANVAYVNSSENKDRVFAIPKKSADILSIKNPNYFRSKRIFDFVDTAATAIIAKKGDKEIELKQGDANRWTFVKPKNLGFAGFESEQEEKEKDKKKDIFKEKDEPVSTGGVKGLLSSIKNIRVDDDEHFVPLGKPASFYGVEAGKESMRIEIISGDKKETETLLIGEKVLIDKSDFYYARLDGDDGVMKISAKWLEPIVKALDEPGKIRSLDVAAFDKKLVDAVVIKQGSDKTEFFKQEKDEIPNPHMPAPPTQSWELVQGKEKKKANADAIETLLTEVLGRKKILEFHDGTEDELKKKEAGWGLEKTAAEIAVYVNGIEKDTLGADKKDEKKDAKKEEKKDETKKDEKTDGLPNLKKGVEPEVTLAIGAIDKDKGIVHIRRTLKDGTVSRFTMKKEFVEKVLPAEGVELAYLKTSAPGFSLGDVASVKLKRITDKGIEVLDLEHRVGDGRMNWFVKDKPADSKKVENVVGMLSVLPVKKWLKKVGEKEDLDKLGLKSVVSATILAKKQLGATAVASLFGDFASERSGIEAVLGAMIRRDADLETVKIELGKETDDEKDKPGAFATHSGAKNMLFLVPNEIVKMILRENLYEITAVVYSQAEMEALYKGNAFLNPPSLLMFASPFFTGTTQPLDADKVKEVRLLVRTPYELRSFHFERVAKKEEEKPKEAGKDEKGKDKEKEKAAKSTWEDKSGLKEFSVDSDKVALMVKDLAKRPEQIVATDGAKHDEYKLADKDAPVKTELILDDGKTVTVTIGANYLSHGHFATSSLWPNVVFFIPRPVVTQILEGASHFSKARAGAD